MPEIKELKTRAWQAHTLLVQLFRQLEKGIGHGNLRGLQHPQLTWPSLHEKDCIHLRYTLSTEAPTKGYKLLHGRTD